ncbi:unnamed protein product [Closterium sp. NIES-64]|nr:unnamed protein product [Closterium sp. NIES-64]
MIRRCPRVVSPSSLLSLYRFISSHLGISSPSTVASLLTSKPQLLRSNATNDLLPRVRLLQSYGISNADIVRITVREPAWLRVSLPQIQNTLEFLLAQGVRRSRLGFVLLHGQGLICSEARSTNLDILVEKAGVPVDKVGVVIEKYPSILTRSNESVNTQLQMLSAYFTAEFGGKVETDSTSTSLLKQQLNEPHLVKNRLSKLILSCPVIFSAPPYRMAENIAILQSFTPPGTPNIATNVLQRAPTIACLSSETLLAKLQFFVELVGKQAAGRVARSHPVVLQLSKENVQGKVAVLADLIGRENAVRVVTQFPLLLASTEDGLEESFRELVREVEEALESSGGERNGRQRLGEGDRELTAVAAVAGAGAARGGGGDSVSATSLLLCPPLLLLDGTGGDVAATAAVAVALLDLLQFLWVVVCSAVAEELLYRALLITALQENRGRIDAAMLSAALSALFHLSHVIKVVF